MFIIELVTKRGPGGRLRYTCWLAIDRSLSWEIKMRWTWDLSPSNPRQEGNRGGRRTAKTERTFRLEEGREKTVKKIKAAGWSIANKIREGLDVR